MEVIEFRFLDLNDIFDKKYEAWSRIYEYSVVLNKLKNLGATENSIFHNTSWGFEGCHVTFKNDLDALYKNVIHSDVKKSNLPNTIIYDITQKIDKKYHNHFDFVLNISTVEEVNYPNVEVIGNLFEQVKPGGYLIITFDYNKDLTNSYGTGSINLLEVEKFCKKSCEPIQSNSINGANSLLPNNVYHNLNTGILILKKI